MNWWHKAREAGRKQLSGTKAGQPAATLRSHLMTQAETMMGLQVRLESFKMFGHGDLTDIKDVLQKMAQGLLQFQETVRALGAIG